MNRIATSSLPAAAILAVGLLAPAPSFAWCAAMGGYSSFEEQARAEARKQREANRAQVRSDQQALYRLGYYQGPIDGQAGPETTAAITRFRVAVKLFGGDSLDDASRRALNNCVAALDRPSEAGKNSEIDDACCAAGARNCPAATAKK